MNGLHSDSGGVALALRDVVCTFGGVRAVDRVTFDIPQASIAGLIGPNGAGKSTVMNIISGVSKPDSGRVCAFGADVTGLETHKLARLGVVRTSQLSSEFSKLTVLENMMVAAPGQRGECLIGALLGRRHWWPQEVALVARARELLAEFGLAALANEYAGRLSGGQKRLLELARALMAQPRIVLLDEPLAGINPTLAERILELLEKLRERGLTILMAEHDLAAVGRTCEPVIIMAQGRMVAQGRMEELQAREDVRDAYFGG